MTSTTLIREDAASAQMITTHDSARVAVLATPPERYDDPRELADELRQMHAAPGRLRRPFPLTLRRAGYWVPGALWAWRGVVALGCGSFRARG